MFVKEGDAVKKGSLLAVLSGKVAEFNQEAAAIKAAFDSRASNESKLTDAKRLADLAFQKMKVDSALYMRQKNLWNEQIGTRVELEQRELAWENAQTDYLLAKQRIEDIQKQINFNEQIAQKKFSRCFQCK